jgi:hypothetical protein
MFLIEQPLEVSLRRTQFQPEKKQKKEIKLVPATKEMKKCNVLHLLIFIISGPRDHFYQRRPSYSSPASKDAITSLRFWLAGAVSELRPSSSHEDVNR